MRRASASSSRDPGASASIAAARRWPSFAGFQRRVGGARKAFVDHGIAGNCRPEQPRCYRGHRCSAIGLTSFACHCRRGTNAYRLAIGAEPVAHAAHKHCHVSPLASPIGMEFVEYDEVEAVRVGNHRAVKGALPRHEQLEHHEIGEKDVGLRVADALALLLAFLASGSARRSAAADPATPIDR